MPAKAGIPCGSVVKIFRKIAPFAILRMNEVMDFPFAVPFLDALFAMDGFKRCRVFLIIYEHVKAIAFRKTFMQSIFVLINPAR